MTIRTLTSFAFVALFATFASAQELRSACHEDIKRFCSDVEPGGGRVLACLKAHELNLSDNCRAARATMRVHGDEFRTACGQDVERLCPGIAPGDGRLNACMRSHKADVSEPCRNFFRAARERHEAGTE